MTLLKHERTTGPYRGQEQPQSQDFQDYSVAEQESHLTPQQKFAKNAVSRFFDWIDQSPNNPNYHESEAYKRPRDWLEANGYRLEEDITTRLTDLTNHNIPADMARFWHFYNDAPKTGEDNHLISKMFEATDIAYAGIKDVVEKARHYTLDDSIEQIDRDIIEAIGATIVRSYYFDQLADAHPGTLTAEQLSNFNNLYRQNIISDIQRAGILHKQAESVEPHDNVVQLNPSSDNTPTQAAA